MEMVLVPYIARDSGTMSGLADIKRLQFPSIFHFLVHPCQSVLPYNIGCHFFPIEHGHVLKYYAVAVYYLLLIWECFTLEE